MIGRLQGRLAHKEPPALIVDVNGVGYELEAPMTTFYDLPAVGQQVTLYTHLVVREDAHLLYGFSSEGQRRLFRGLLKVNGIGPRVALALLSGLTEQELIRCIGNEDVARLTEVPGIGRKTAERLVMEMRGRLAREGAVADSEARSPERVDPPAEAVSALIALGYKPQEASRVVRALDTTGLKAEEIIRQALQRMAS